MKAKGEKKWTNADFALRKNLLKLLEIISLHEDFLEITNIWNIRRWFLVFYLNDIQVKHKSTMTEADDV